MKGGATRWQIVKTGSSYLSQSELPLSFGLGSASSVDRVGVNWPSGRVDTAGPFAANQVVTLKEGAGALSAMAIPRVPQK